MTIINCPFRLVLLACLALAPRPSQAVDSAAALPAAGELPVRAAMPDPLVTEDGRKISTPEQWKARREQMKETLAYYALGHAPPPPGNVTGSVRLARKVMDGRAECRMVHLTFGPEGKLGFDATLFIPAETAAGKAPFPTIVQPSFSANHDTNQPPDTWDSAARKYEEPLRRGYAIATFAYQQCGLDKPQGYRESGFFPAYPGCDWGDLAAWAWGMSRCVDYLQDQPFADKSKLIAVGHSRLGKTALVAGAFDERFALTAPAGSGCGGTGAYRFNGKGRGGKEGLEDATRKFPQWFGPRLAEFAGQVEKLPFDQHWLIALIAPRCFIAADGLSDPYANGNALAQSYLAAKPVFALLGVPDRLGINFRPGAHLLAPEDWTAILDFADRQLRHLDVKRRFDELPLLGAAEPPIDPVRGHQLMDKFNRGETLTPEESAYLDRVRQAIRERAAGKRPGSAPQTPAARPVEAGTNDWNALVPIPDLTAPYKGEDGGLYGGGKNDPPEAHRAAHLKVSEQIRPLDADGRPSAGGKIGLITIGFSNTSIESEDFKRAADADPQKSPCVVIVNGAIGGRSAVMWAWDGAAVLPPAEQERLDREMDLLHMPKGIRRSGPGLEKDTWPTLARRIAAAGLSSNQVQAVWLKHVEANPKPLGEFPAHARALQADVTDILVIARRHYPNLRVVYLSSRTFGGWSGRESGSPEPYAYESGFGTRWVVQSQVRGEPQLNCDPARGAVKAPLVLWGPYLWAQGNAPRKLDGLTWTEHDVRADRLHPNEAGARKTTALLLNFFKTNEGTRRWFLQPGEKARDGAAIPKVRREKRGGGPERRDWERGGREASKFAFAHPLFFSLDTDI